MKRTIIATALFLGMMLAASAADQTRPRTGSEAPDGRMLCTVEVLRSEELPGAPIFQNLVRATLLVNPPGSPPFETTVVKLIPYQMPPPRRGQRMTLYCDPANLGSPIFY
jgi:hypothetical protein